ncbi:hypothetical protein ACFU98_10735 [Streptomyces sp. NPDC057575]|uniref:hypothetical protein n=1 Tax=unclassified Streptomyces TaxID=2593676 RepID=UPI0036A55285
MNGYVPPPRRITREEIEYALGADRLRRRAEAGDLYASMQLAVEQIAPSAWIEAGLHSASNTTADVPEEQPATGKCPWCWGSHACDLPTGHDGDHQCRLGHVEQGDAPDTRPRGHPDLFHYATEETQ